MRSLCFTCLFLLFCFPYAGLAKTGSATPQIPDAVHYDADFNMLELYMVDMKEKLENTLDKTPLPFMHFAPKAEESILLRFMQDYKEMGITISEQETALMAGLQLGGAAAYTRFPPGKMKEKPFTAEQYCRAVPEGVTPIPVDLLLAVRPTNNAFLEYPPRPMDITAEEVDRLVDAFAQRYEEAGQNASRRRAAISAGMALGWADYLKRLEEMESGYLSK